jgi:tRNA pseudouridine65 synthase
VLPILFRDDHLVAVHKPSGLLVHRTGLDHHERRFAVQLLRAQLGRRVHPVHRLDKGASGALLFALSPEVASLLGEAVRRRALHRTYVAVVRGHPKEAGEIDHPLARQAEGTRAAAREAMTRYRRLATAELPHRVDRYPTSRYALLELQPLTGRQHQLRRHLGHASHPILGDTTWGQGRHNRLFRELFDCRRLLLACVELRLDHPVTGAPLEVTAPLAGDFGALVDALGWTPALPPGWLPE